MTNKLEPKPTKLKLWAGIKSVNGPSTREVGIINKWVSHGPDASPSEVGLRGVKANINNGGPLPYRPPYQVQHTYSNDALVGDHTKSSAGDGSRVRRSDEAASGARSASSVG